MIDWLRVARRCTWVNADDLDTFPGVKYHFAQTNSSPGYTILGERFAEATLAMLARNVAQFSDARELEPAEIASAGRQETRGCPVYSTLC